MTRSSPILTSTAIGLCLVSQSAMADVTPADVWQDWRDYMQGLGYSMTATENQSGDTLTISDLQLDLSSGAEDGEVRMTVEALNLVQNEDGTVSIVMPEVMPLVLEVTPTIPEAEALRMALTLTQTGQDMTVSGTPDDMSSEYVAGLINLKLDQVTVDDQTYDAENARFEMLMTDVKAQSETTIGQMRDYRQSGTVSEVTYNMRFKDPDEPAVATIDGTSSEISFTGDGQMPLGLTQVTDMTSMLRAGWNAAATINGGASTLTVDVEDPENGNMAAAFASESSALTIETNADGVSYAGTREGSTLSVQPPQMPFPLSATLDNAAFNLSAPVLQSDTPQDFALGLDLNELTLSDMIWGMFDPQGNLPRDPANIALDVTGEATLMTNFMDPAATQDMAAMSGLPGLLNSVDLNALVVDALGARLTGNGSAEFDNSDPDAPMQPTGTVDLRLEGGNTLLDTLVSSGLLPEQMAMGARMMIGMFAKPGDGPDTLTSRLEFTRSGGILANGQRIR